MIEFIIVGIIVVILCGIIYYKKDTIIPWMKRNKKKAGAIITAAIAGSSMASAGLFGVPSLELDIEDYLIEDLADYEALGINVDKIVNPIVYEEQVLCEGHLPLAFKFSMLSDSVVAGSDFISISQVMKTNMELKDLSYKVLVNETYTVEKPIYKEEEYTYSEVDNKTGKNITTSDTRIIIDGYKEVSDYRYVWKDFSPRTFKQGDIVIIDIIGSFKASTFHQSVDIIPTLKIESKSDVSYSKQYNEYAWWNNNWIYKKSITLDSSQVQSTLTNFPVCINITDTDLRDKAQSDGDDIAFTDSTESTQLNHEIEYYNGTTGRLVAWVNVTSLAHDADTVIYMYYNNSAAANQESVEDVWDTSVFHAVYHFHNSSLGSQIDSTSNGYDITSNGNGVTRIEDADGWGYSADFDGDVDYLACPNLDTFFNNPFTVGLWLKPDDGQPTDTPKYIFAGRDDDGTDESRFRIYHYNDDYDMRYEVGSSYDTVQADNVFSDGSQSSYTCIHHIVDGSNLKIFKDGVLENQVSQDNAVPMSNYCNDVAARSPYIGNRNKDGSASSDDYEGNIEEVRLYCTDISNDSLVCEYNSMNNATDGGFFTLGSEEESSSVFQINGLPSNNITFYGYQGNTVWCNSSGTGNETMRLYQELNNTQEVTGHDIYVENMTDGSGNWFSAANITLYASSDNASFGVPSDDDGNGNGVFIDGGSVITLNTSTWNAGTMGSDPYPIENLTSDTIYVRFKADIPGSLSIDTTYFSSNDTSTWAMPFYVNFTGNDGV